MADLGTTDADLRPWRYVLRQGRAGLEWSSGQPLGRPDSAVVPHTRVALERMDRDTVALFAMGMDGTPQRYLLARGTDWRTEARAGVPTRPATGGFLPNPYSDLATVQTGGPQGIVLAYAGVAAGAVAALVVPGAGGTPLAFPS
jgi:hypothetical protein